MKKHLHRLLTLLLLLIGSSSLFAHAKTITFDATKDKGTQFDGDSTSISKEGITIASKSGRLASDSTIKQYRFYVYSNCIITSTVGNITKVVFSSINGHSSPSAFVLRSTTGRYNQEKCVWTGNATSLIFTNIPRINVDKIEVTVDTTTADASNVPATISSAGWSTYVSRCPLSFADTPVKAFTAKYDASANSITLSPVTEIPANTAVVLKGDAGTYSFTRLASATLPISNDLTFNDSECKVETAKTIYVLAKQGDVCGFYPLASGETLPANKGYIKISNPSTAKSVYGLHETTTGIHHVVKADARSGARLNLAGQRVSDSYKGVVIENGKKFVVK